jgi:non-ribosomal peptide synthetase component E (peptide arylation enzyme)
MDINIGRLLAKRALLDGNRLALVAEERRLSFAELDREACRAAAALMASGVRAGDRVAALMRYGLEYVAL